MSSALVAAEQSHARLVLWREEARMCSCAGPCSHRIASHRIASHRIALQSIAKRRKACNEVSALSLCVKQVPVPSSLKGRRTDILCRATDAAYNTQVRVPATPRNQTLDSEMYT
eukprot:1455031-Rhodomonas_salina.2